MSIRWRTALVLTLTSGVGAAIAADNKPAQEPAKRESVEVRFTKASPERIRALRGGSQASRALAFRDPVTGELGPADPGQQAALVGQPVAAGAARRAAPEVLQSKSGVRMLRGDKSNIEYMTATKSADGKVVVSCSGIEEKESRDEK